MAETAEIMDDRCMMGDLCSVTTTMSAQHSTDPCVGLACVQVASDDFTSPMIRGDRREEGRDTDRAREKERVRRKRPERSVKPPERGMGDGAAQ